MRKLLYVLLLVCITGGGNAQSRPKVGLVLSGGGAKGLAHIGFIKKMEEAGIYPDIVTGTSMGSVVGGLYAMGYSPAEMEDIVERVDWSYVLSNTIPFPERAIEEKPYNERYIAELPIIEGKPSIPKGLIQGQELSNLLNQLTRSAHHIQDFDNLPIPFACVATDITTGEPVVLRQGSLPQAIRASMAIPSVFTPVKIDGRLLVDGGLVRNFPVQEALDMGADIIIGVFVSDDFLGEDELNSLVDILTQSAFVTSVLDTREQRKKVDLYVEPDLTGYSTFSFDDGDSIIARGVSAGEAVEDQLVALAQRLQGLQPPMHQVEKLVEANAYVISQVSVNNHEVDSDFLVDRLNIAPGESVTIDDLDRKIETLYGTGYYESIEYNLVPTVGGFVLEVTPQYAPKTKFKFALHYNDETRAGITFNLTSRNTLGKNSRALAEIDLSQNPRFDLNYLKYIGKKRELGVQAGADIYIYDFPVIAEGIVTSEFRNRFIDAYLQFIKTGSTEHMWGLRSGVRHSSINPRVEGFFNFLDKESERHPYVQLFYLRNTLNKRFFPTKGIRWNIKTSYIFSNSTDFKLTFEDTTGVFDNIFRVEPFFEFSAQAQSNHPLNERLTLQWQAVLHGVGNRGIGLANAAGLGGFYPSYRNIVPFYGVRFYEFTLKNLAMLGLGMQWELFADFYLTGVFQSISTEYPFTWFVSDLQREFLNNETYLFGGGVEIGYMSIIGPITINLGKASHTPDWQFGFQIGFYL